MRKFLFGVLACVVLAGGYVAHAVQNPAITIGGSSAAMPLIRATAKTAQARVRLHTSDSTTGLAQVAARRVSIGASDVFAKPTSGLVDHPLAVIGITPVINPHTGVKALTTTQLRQIFAKRLTNWRQLGGKDLKIVVASRQPGSGTLANFRQLALANAAPAADHRLASTQALRRFVETHAGAIGFLPFAAVSAKLTAVPLDGVAPTTANVVTNRWRLWSYEHLYTKGSPDATTAKFIHHLQTRTRVIRAQGAIPLDAMQVARTANGAIEDTHN